MALGRFWNFIDGESWGFGGGVTMKSRIANRFVPMRSMFGYGFVAIRFVFGFAMGERKT